MWSNVTRDGIISLTRLHSSRMHTARLLTVSSSMHCAGEGSAFGGCLLWGVCFHGGVCFGGSTSRGMSASRGVCFWGGGIPACTEADPPCEQND